MRWPRRASLSRSPDALRPSLLAEKRCLRTRSSPGYRGVLTGSIVERQRNAECKLATLHNKAIWHHSFQRALNDVSGTPRPTIIFAYGRLDPARKTAPSVLPRGICTSRHIPHLTPYIVGYRQLARTNSSRRLILAQVPLNSLLQRPGATAVLLSLASNPASPCMLADLPMTFSTMAPTGVPAGPVKAQTAPHFESRDTPSPMSARFRTLIGARYGFASGYMR